MGAQQTFTPADTAELVAVIEHARTTGLTLDLRGGGTHADWGMPIGDDVAQLNMARFAGVVDYDPAELVLTVRPATPLHEIEALLAQSGQALAFDPWDMAPLWGREPGAATIGGVIAAGVAGSRRVSRGATRDHLLGFRAVSGRGEAFLAGARVTKNVTGYDLPKLACGSRGRLFAMTELDIKVLPQGETSTTLAFDGLAPDRALAVMRAALASNTSVASAAHDPAIGVTALRLDGFAASVRARVQALRAELVPHGIARIMPDSEAAAFHRAMHRLDALAGAPVLWRVVVPARAAMDVVGGLDPDGWRMDWGGGLIWIADEGPIRDLAAAAGGHADLVRAPEALRRSVPPRKAQAPGLAALESRVIRAFDPAGVFATGRFGEG